MKRPPGKNTGVWRVARDLDRNARLLGVGVGAPARKATPADLDRQWATIERPHPEPARVTMPSLSTLNGPLLRMQDRLRARRGDNATRPQASSAATPSSAMRPTRL